MPLVHVLAHAITANGVCLHLLVPPLAQCCFHRCLLNITACTVAQIGGCTFERKAPFATPSFTKGVVLFQGWAYFQDYGTTEAKILFSFSMAAEKTVEAKTMRKHYADLTQAIQDPLRLAANLYSENLIARNVLDSTIESPHTKVEKTMHLLQAVSDQIANNPEDFHSFLAVLRKDSSLEVTAMLMSSTYSK